RRKAPTSRSRSGLSPRTRCPLRTPRAMRAEADRALLTRLFAETGASRSLSEAGWQEYVRDLSLAVANWLSDALAPVARSLGARLEWLELAAAAFVIVILGLLVFFVGRALVRGLSRRNP